MVFMAISSICTKNAQCMYTQRKSLLKLHVNEWCSKPMYSGICFKFGVKLKHVKFFFRVYMAHMWSVKIY